MRPQRVVTDVTPTTKAWTQILCRPASYGCPADRFSAVPVEPNAIKVHGVAGTRDGRLWRDAHRSYTMSELRRAAHVAWCCYRRRARLPEGATAVRDLYKASFMREVAA